MGATSKTFVDNNPPQVEAADLNGLNLEQKNLIEDSGQVFSAADQEQQSKAVSNFSANGNFYGDSGAADAYVLTPIGNAKGITAYANGQRFRFRPANTNTGASTVAVNGLAAKDIKDVNGNALVAGLIYQDEQVEIEYDSTAGYFVLISNNDTKPEEILTDSITAYSGGGQANAVELTTEINIITTCAASGDSVKMTSSFKKSTRRIIINNAAKIVDVFPASGDDLGAGVDTAIKLLPGNTVEFIGTTANSTWKLVSGQVQISDVTLSSTGQNSWSQVYANADLKLSTITGKLRLRGNIGGSVSAGSRGSQEIYITNVVFKNNSGTDGQPLIGINNAGALIQYSIAVINSSTILQAHNTVSTSRYEFSFDVELESQTLI